MHPQRSSIAWVVVAMLVFAPLVFEPPTFAAQPNTRSPLGTNVTFFRDAASEWSVVDVFRQSRDWIFQNCAPNCASIQVDAAGWIQSMPAGAFADTLMLDGFSGHYPAGSYTVVYQGQGTIQYLGDAALLSSIPGKDVVQVNPSSAGIRLRIAATNAADPLRNIHVLLPGYDETNFETQPGHPKFHPSFTGKIQKYRTIRFMNWQETNGSALTDWASRPKLGDARWSKPGHGAPVEMLVDLANEMKSDLWVNMPHMATDDFITQFAVMVRDSLSPNLRVYVEYSNEVWGGFPQGTWIEQQGVATWPASPVSAFDKRLNWFGMRTAQICDLWRTAWGAASDRVVCVMGTSGGNSSTSTKALDCTLWTQGTPCWDHDIKALAMGGYFGGYIGTPTFQSQVQAWTADVDGGLTALFQEMTQGGVLAGGPSGGAVQATLGGAGAQLAVASARGLELVAYEGGQALYGSGGVENDAAITNLFITANRDARMGAVYAQFFAGWRALGGHLFNHFNNVSQSSNTGSWGSLEYMDQSSSPKFDALMTFMTGNPCWWPGCALVIPSGRVPGDLAGEAPLTISKAVADAVVLSWDPGCSASDTDASIQEGSLGDFTSHTPVICSTSGATSWTLNPSAGDRYYLVVPTNGDYEGSYGLDGTGMQRAAASAPCLPQSVGTCP